MNARVVEGQLKYLQYILRGEGNILLERIVEDMRLQERKNKWIKELIENRGMVGVK